MDRRWQLVLDCLDCEQAPFGKGTLVRFRAMLIAAGGDRRLIERTVEMAKDKGGFSSRSLPCALDSSPLWGAARVEDTYNLLGHALRKALGVIARGQSRELSDVAKEAGAEMVASSSLKPALDLDWDDPIAKAQALTTILQAMESVESWVQQLPDLDDNTSSEVKDGLAVGRQVQAQDVEVTPSGSPKLRQSGRAHTGASRLKMRRCVTDAFLRSQRFDGYKRHVLKDLDIGVVRAVGITQAFVPEAAVTNDLATDLEPQNVKLEELHIDRAYLSSQMVKQRPEDVKIVCKAWPVRNGKHNSCECFYFGLGAGHYALPESSRSKLSSRQGCKFSGRCLCLLSFTRSLYYQ